MASSKKAFTFRTSLDTEIKLARIETYLKTNKQFESNIQGLFPCGEGAGYAGGITSAAMDGIKTAEAIAEKILTQN